jgi:hypothetical protein
MKAVAAFRASKLRLTTTQFSLCTFFSSGKLGLLLVHLVNITGLSVGKNQTTTHTLSLMQV